MTSNIQYITNKQKTVPVAELYSMFKYDHITGELYRLTRGKFVKQTRVDECGYIVTTINGKQFMVHRVIWALVYGEWPNRLIDHINRNKDDNRLDNLRASNHQKNTLNSKCTNRLGFKGVAEHTKLDGTKRYTASLSIKGTRITGGAWDTPEEAHQAYLNLVEKYVNFENNEECKPFTRQQQFDHMMSVWRI